MIKRSLVIVATCLLAGLTGVALATPITGSSANGTPGGDPDFYETVDNTPNGIPSEVGPQIPWNVNTQTSPGYIVFLDSGVWGSGQISDALYFHPQNGVGYTDYIQLFSEGTPNMPTWADILAFQGPGVPWGLQEDPSGVTDASGYIVHSSEAVPDAGSTLGLLSGAFVMIGALGRRFRTL